MPPLPRSTIRYDIRGGAELLWEKYFFHFFDSALFIESCKFSYVIMINEHENILLGDQQKSVSWVFFCERLIKEGNSNGIRRRCQYANVAPRWGRSTVRSQVNKIEPPPIRCYPNETDIYIYLNECERERENVVVVAMLPMWQPASSSQASSAVQHFNVYIYTLEKLLCHCVVYEIVWCLKYNKIK